MKKIMRGICLMAVVAMIATSCNKNDETSTIKIVTEPFEEEEATLDGDDGAKVYLGQSNYLYFEAADQVRVFNIATKKSALYVPVSGLVDGQNMSTWTLMDGEVDPGFNAGNMYAFSPGNLATPHLENENRVTFTLPATQTYRYNNCPIECMFQGSKGEGNVFNFYNTCGLMQLRLWNSGPETKTVTRIEVTNGQQSGIGTHLSGDVSVKLDKIDKESLKALFGDYIPGDSTWLIAAQRQIRMTGYYVADGASRTVTLDCGAGATLGTSEGAPTNFYISLRPLALYYGFTAVVYYREGNDPTEHYYTISSTKNNVIRFNKIKKFKAIEIK